MPGIRLLAQLATALHLAPALAGNWATFQSRIGLKAGSASSPAAEGVPRVFVLSL